MNKYVIIFLVLTIAIYACKSNLEDTHDEHDHDEVKILLVGYSNGFEIFAEADPFVVGSTSTVLVHITHLETFKPLQDGTVTLSLIVGTKGIRQSIKKPEQPGIYPFKLKPEVVGGGRIIVDIETGSFKQQIEVSGIGVFPNEHSAILEAQVQEVKSSNAIVFTKEQSWKIDFATEYPAIEAFGQLIKTTAQVQPAQADEVIVTAKTRGIVTLVNEGLLEGKTIAANELLLIISGSGLAEESWIVKFTEAKNNFEKARINFERLSQLANDKIVTQTELLAAKTDYENAKVLHDNIVENFSAKGQRVNSPFGGFAKQIFVQNGQYVEVGQPLVTVSQNRSLILLAEVQQRYAPVLGTIAGANIRSLYDSRIYTLKELNGKVVSYGRSVNPSNFLVPVSLQIDNKGAFVPGSFVEVYLKVLSNAMALTIPNSALLEEQGLYFVFVQLTPELFEKVEVKIGATDGLRTEILRGIGKNDRIVAKGARLVKLAQASAALDPHSGHVH
jgi:RND family efflux transporter MFP subunit